MADMLDYLAWRGDIPLDFDGLNEADAAVLARFAYIPFEYFAGPPAPPPRATSSAPTSTASLTPAR